MMKRGIGPTRAPILHTYAPAKVTSLPPNHLLYPQIMNLSLLPSALRQEQENLVYFSYPPSNTLSLLALHAFSLLLMSSF